MMPPHHHHRLAIYHHCLSATALNPYPYTTTDPYPYTTTATIYHHRCHILPPYIHHQSEFFSYSVCFRDPYIFRFVFPCLSRSQRKESGDPRAVFRPKFRQPKIFFPYPIFRPRVVFWDTRHHSDFLSHFFVVAALISEKKIVKKFCAHPVSLTWEEFWDTRHYSDFSQKKKSAKKKSAKKRAKKNFQSVLFPCLRAAPWFC